MISIDSRPDERVSVSPDSEIYVKTRINKTKVEEGYEPKARSKKIVDWGYVYVIEQKDVGDIYIGHKCSNNPDTDRYLGSGRYVYKFYNDNRHKY